MTSDNQRQADRQLDDILTAEAGRIMLTPSAEAPLPGEMEALDAAEAEFAQGKTHRLDDVLRQRPIKPCPPARAPS
jgi:hypothetical protein